MQSPKQFLTALVLILASTSITNCAKSAATSDASSVSDSSASGAAASAAGGALSNSNGSGAQAQMKFNLEPTMMASVRSELNPLANASAASLCPSARTTGTGTGCTTSGANLYLAYGDCTFTGNAEWSGVQALTMSAGVAACGTFPNPGANGTLYRQFVSAAGANTPGSLTLTAHGRTATVDDASANLSNFDLDTIATIVPSGGYGAAITFASGARSQIQLGHHVSLSGGYDHSVSGTLSVSEVAGAGQRTLSGSLKVYHNLLKVVGTSTFNAVVHQDICCLPISGSITTLFSAGTSVTPTIAGAKMVGKSETLTFTGCGTATLQNTDGSSASVTLDRCF